MNKKKSKRKFSYSVIFVSILNVLILFLWFSIKIIPMMEQVKNFRNTIVNDELKNSFSSYEDLNDNIEKIEDKYEVVFIVEDSDGKILLSSDVSKDIPIVTRLVEAGDEVYLLKIYSKRSISITGVVIELIIFQIVVSSIISGIIYLSAHQFILKPVDRIIDDIRNYKFGKKPKKREVTNEFDLIANEFVYLTDTLDKEKQEQNRIIASISHDIKTPLTSIIGYSELLKEQTQEEDTLKYINKISDKALHIKDLLSTFDDYIVNQEKISLNKTTIQIKDLVDKLNSDYKIDLENKKIKFNIVSNVSDYYIDVDIVKLKRIFSNMISNSIRFLNSNGVINIKISKDEDFIKFKVSDNGPGVDKKIIDRIFDPLFTTDYSRKIHGLGLSICKEFVEMHGGTIKAYNNKGLTIEFTIPIIDMNK